MAAGRLVVVTTGTATPPGVLTWPAWQALRSGPVFVAGADHPQLPSLLAAGVQVAVLDAPDDLPELLRSDQDAVWLAPPGHGPPDVMAGVQVNIVPGSYDLPGTRLLDVVAVMDRLRSPGGCPWDAEQTHASLAPFLIEEAYEALEAVEDDDSKGLREELGDVLLQVAFHARLAQERAQPWSIDDVAGDLVAKLVRRHPHVFAGASAADLETSWEQSKAAEKGRTSVTDGVPLGQPALALAAKLQRRARRLGAPVPAAEGLGGRLWELVRECGEQGVDPEAALRDSARAYRDALATAERAARAAGLDPAELTSQQWQRWLPQRLGGPGGRSAGIATDAP